MTLSKATRIRSVLCLLIKKIIIILTPWPKSTSELYRPSDCRLPAKLVPTFADRGMSRSQRRGSPRPYSTFFTGVPTFSCK
jgi:hypothetical protein